VTEPVEPYRQLYADLWTGHYDYRVTSEAGAQPTDWTAQRGQANRLTLIAPFMVYDGYGSMAEYLALGMVRAGATVDVSPLALDAPGLTGEFRAILQRSRPDPVAPVLYSAPVIPEFEQSATPELFVNTMWESSRLPADWVGTLNRARATIVPSTFLVTVFRASGVTVPVEVVPDGVDPAVYEYIERPIRAEMTTLIVATPVGRKHMQEGVTAWKRAFAGEPAARLKSFVE
jgi:hypothetical protein